MTQTPKPRRLGRIVLVASLALNVLLAGGIIGALASADRGTPRGYDFQLGPVGQVLSQDQRREVGRELRRAIRDAGLRRPQERNVMARLVALLEAESFDAAAFQAAISAEQRRLDDMRGIAIGVFGDYLSDLSQADRAAIAASLKEQVARGAFDRNGPKRGDSPPSHRD